MAVGPGLESQAGWDSNPQDWAVGLRAMGSMVRSEQVAVTEQGRRKAWWPERGSADVRMLEGVTPGSKVSQKQWLEW